MKVLLVIHGYPMRYNAGSEVYTQALAHALAERHEVRVFTRDEDPFRPDYACVDEVDRDDGRVRLRVVNVPRSRDRYRHEGVDLRFEELARSFRPDVVHIGHLNHLSTSIVDVAVRLRIPVVFTLHDYWLMCPRGQFMQMHPSEPADLWPVCQAQDDRTCATRCYARYFSGGADEVERDVAHWTDWVHRRMDHARALCQKVDRFIAPSRYLYDRFRDEFGLDPARLTLLGYGFDPARLRGRRRTREADVVFGYIGTHIPAKGVHLLLEAFGHTRGPARLRVFGRPRGETTSWLRRIVDQLPEERRARIEWLDEYRNQDIVQTVFDRVDAIVVPSIWVENSPLVIHEAQQARVPVVTSEYGGMGELVRHEVNGLTFRHRDVRDMAAQMQRLIDEPSLLARLGERGFLAEPRGDVPSMEEHVRAVEAIYDEVAAPSPVETVKPGPWRITFDTNPDDCNLRCVMCEEHSTHSPLRIRRKEEATPRRRMPIELMRGVLEERRGSPLREIIPSTMGEPLLYEDFEEILAMCREFGVLLNLTTNGTFPRLGARAWARRIVPVTSDVKVSWNGATRETAEAVMVGIDWDDAIRNVRELIAVRDEHAATGGNRCRITFQMTFMERNFEELAAIVHLAASLGVDRVKGHHLWAHWEVLHGESMRRDADAVRRWNAAVREARAAAEEARLPGGRKVVLENIHELDEGDLGDLAPGGPCPFLGQEAWVSAKGRFAPCCAPDEQRRTLGDFGTVHDRSLGDIWADDEYRALTETYYERPLCKGCNMRRREA
ncbi:MAG: glycosyltransferase [Polyangiales bacterium]